ncbi:MAG: hypothetical protein ACFE85_08685 [Candidatus Hodarchaeota archaeon]
MTIIFFINSKTVNIDKYKIKDIPGSTGRFDVISRCIISALVEDGGFERDIQIWTFLEKYGTFIFDSNTLDYQIFPKNEILLTDYFVKLIKEGQISDINHVNPLNSIEYREISIIEAIKLKREQGYNIYILNENGRAFFKYKAEILSINNVVFVIGSQSGEVIESAELKELNLPNLSLGNQSYLASSVIRLIKLNLML